MARKPEPPPRPSRITVPARCHAAVKVIFAEMQRQAVTYDELEFRSGVLKSTFKAWRTNNRPGLETVEAALGSLGWAFLPVPSLSQLPPSIREGLQALAAEWGDVNPLLCELLANVCGVRVRGAHPSTVDGLTVVVPPPERKAKRGRAARLHPDQSALFDLSPLAPAQDA